MSRSRSSERYFPLISTHILSPLVMGVITSSLSTLASSSLESTTRTTVDTEKQPQDSSASPRRRSWLAALGTPFTIPCVRILMAPQLDSPSSNFCADQLLSDILRSMMMASYSHSDDEYLAAILFVSSSRPTASGSAYSTRANSAVSVLPLPS